MTWDELAMVNLQSKPDGSWSYTAYKRPFTLWRSNKALPDVFCCIEDIMHEIALADDIEGAAAVHDVLAKSAALDEAIDASGGISGKPARGKKSEFVKALDGLGDAIVELGKRKRKAKR